MEPIEVITHCKNPEYPTRVTITDLDGHFEHAGDYTHPKYNYSLHIEVKYNKVIEGKEENLVTFSFWTCEDSPYFSFQDDDLTEEEVEDWFLEGLSEDLSFHNLEGLETLDLYEAGVPTQISINQSVEPKKSIISAITQACGEIVNKYKCLCSKLYFKGDTEELREQLKEKALKDYQGFLWRTKSYMTDRNREYKKAALEGLIKDLADMTETGKKLFQLADTEDEGKKYLMKRDRNLGQQVKYCEEWMDRLGIEHKTFEEYVKRPLD